MNLLLGWFELWTQYPGSVVPLAMFWYRQTHSSYHLKIIIVIITIIIIPASWILETLCGGTPTSSTTSRSGTPAPPSILFSTFQVKSNKSLQTNISKSWIKHELWTSRPWLPTEQKLLAPIAPRSSYKIITAWLPIKQEVNPSRSGMAVM